MSLLEKFNERMRASLLDEHERRYFLFTCAYAVLSLISAVMTVANVFTHKGALTVSTLLYALVCAGVCLLLSYRKIGLRPAEVLFIVSYAALITFFIVTGIPDGFSILWVCLLPACGLLAFGRKTGTILCAGMLLEIVFFLLTPLGRSLLLYDYGATFRMRFPLLYTAFWAASFVLETIRDMTHKKLLEVQGRYYELCSHDALTQVYNRYGFNELMDRYFQTHTRRLALIILDIDHFKDINDRFGHPQGDEALKSVARIICESAGEQACVCRWGGEEFAVLMPECEDIRALAQRVAGQLHAQSIALAGGEVKITASIGAVLALDTAFCTPAELVIAADDCLYRAKMNGRNCVEYSEISGEAPKPGPG